MKGIVLAGGTATRLHPLTNVTNKHLLPVGRLPMIFWPLLRLYELDVREIIVITSRDHMGDIVNMLGSGHDFGVDFTFRVQDQPGGIAQALGLCRDFVGKDDVIVMLGDNIFSSPIDKEFVNKHTRLRCDTSLLLKQVDDPGRYGVVKLEENGSRIVDIVEKPEHPPSSYAVTGCYIYNNKVFDVIPSLKMSHRNELEITDVNKYFLNNGRLDWSFYNGDWTDAGTHCSLLYANQLMKNHRVPVAFEKLVH